LCLVGDLGGGKAKGRGRVGWSELCLVPDTLSPLWHGVAGNTVLLIATRAINAFAEQDGFLHTAHRGKLMIAQMIETFACSSWDKAGDRTLRGLNATKKCKV